MTSLLQTFESLANGAAVTLTNMSGSGPNSSLIQKATGTNGQANDEIVGWNQNPAHGATGIRMQMGASNSGSTRVFWAVNDSTRLVLSTQFNMSGDLGYDDILGMRSLNAGVCDLHVDATGRLVMHNAVGVGINESRSPNPIPFGSYIRVEISAKMGTTTTNGTLGYSYYLGNSAVAEHSWEQTNQNAGTAPITSVWIGRGTGRAVARTVLYDTVRVETRASGWLAPYVLPVTMTVSLPAAQAVPPGTPLTVVATLSDSSSQVSVVEFSRTSGPSVLLEGSGNSRVFKAPPTAAGTTVVIRVAAKNAAGGELAVQLVSYVIEPATAFGPRDGVMVPGYVTSGGTLVLAPRTLPAEPVDERSQLMGDEYVTIQSLNLVNPLSIREAYTKNGNGKILSIPIGEHLDSDFNQTTKAGINMPNTFRGLVGVDDRSLVGVRPGTSTVPSSQIPTARDQATNPYYQLRALGGTPMTFRRFKLAPGAAHLHGGMQVRTDMNKVLIEEVNQFDSAPGNDWTPPGETFGIATWHCEGGATVRNCKGDGNGRGSSLLGFNDTNDILVENCDFRNSPWGMPTFWKCNNITTRNLKSYGGHAGLNQEQVGGVIRHYNLELFPNRNWPTSGANSVAMHSTFQSNLMAYRATLLEYFDPIHDFGLQNGTFMVMSGTNYTVGGGAYSQLQDINVVHVYKTIDGQLRELKRIDTQNRQGMVSDPKTTWTYFH